MPPPRPRGELPGMGAVIRCGCGCGAELREFNAWGRQRRFLHGHSTRRVWRVYKEAEARAKKGAGTGP